MGRKTRMRKNDDDIGREGPWRLKNGGRKEREGEGNGNGREGEWGRDLET